MSDGLRFAHIEYSIYTKSIDIFSIGCDGNCTGCCNPTLKNWELDGFLAPNISAKVLNLCEKYGELIDRIFLVGGDPVDAYKHYPKEYLTFVIDLKSVVLRPIYLFTRYELKDIPDELIDVVDYVKTGAYIPELKTDSNIQYGIKLATSNQNIYDVRKNNERNTIRTDNNTNWCLL